MHIWTNITAKSICIHHEQFDEKKLRVLASFHEVVFLYVYVDKYFTSVIACFLKIFSLHTFIMWCFVYICSYEACSDCITCMST